MEKKTMKVLSLFTGGGLGDFGLELAGMEIVGQCEIDKYCQQILKLRWPDVYKWEDVHDVTGKEVEEKLGRIDLISGGFPCQDISTAGKGAGITGARSGLWKEMFRIIGEVRPRYVLVENVTALLGRGLGVVLGDLAALGYDSEYDCVPASALGAPHQRDRIWIVAYANGQWKSQPKRTFKKKRGRVGNGSKEMADTESVGRIARRPKCKGFIGEAASFKFSGEIPDTKSARRKRWEGREGDRAQPKKRVFGRLDPDRKSEWWSVEPNVGRVANGVAKRVDRLKLLGNGQVVQVVEWIGRCIIQHERSKIV